MGKKWMRILIIMVLAINVCVVPIQAFWFGKDKKITEEEVLQANNELINEVIGYRMEEDSRLYDLFEGMTQAEIETFADELINNKQKFDNNCSQFLINSEPYYVVSSTDYIVTGTMPNTHMEYSSRVLTLSYIDQKWKINQSETAMSAVNSKVNESGIYPEACFDENITNCDVMTLCNFMYLKSDAVFNGCSNVEVKYAYQEPEGDVILGIWIANGADYNIYYKSADITLTDDTMGTILDLQDVYIGTAVKSGSSCVKEICVPLSEVRTGTSTWGCISSDITNYFE